MGRGCKGVIDQGNNKKKEAVANFQRKTEKLFMLD